MPPVTVRVQSNDPAPVRVAGVSAQIYSANSPTLQTTGTTDVNGEVVVLLPDGSYDALFYKQGVSILPSQPQRLVVDSLQGNVFTITASVFSLPQAIDPNLCRITGRVFMANGWGFRGLRLGFTPIPEPFVTPVGLVLPQTVTQTESSTDGYFDFQLFRNATYEGSIALVDVIGAADASLDIRVPDLPALPLESLLFPIPVSAVFSPLSITLSLSAKETALVTGTVTYSDGSIRTEPPPWASYQMIWGGGTVASATRSGSNFLITPLAVGTDTFVVQRALASTSLWQSPPSFTYDTVTVTVTP